MKLKISFEARILQNLYYHAFNLSIATLNFENNLKFESKANYEFQVLIFMLAQILKESYQNDLYLQRINTLAF